MHETKFTNLHITSTSNNFSLIYAKKPSKTILQNSIFFVENLRMVLWKN